MECEVNSWFIHVKPEKRIFIFNIKIKSFNGLQQKILKIINKFRISALYKLLSSLFKV